MTYSLVMPVKSPLATDLRARRRNETRLDIQRAALGLFEQHGFEETTVDEIAREAGVSSRTFFRYFTTKEDSVLFDRYGFDDALHACIASSDLNTFALADVEEAFRTVIESFRDDQSEVASTILRIQRLVTSNSALSTTVIGRCAANSQRLLATLDEECEVAVRSHARMVLEIAQLALQCAFEEWVDTCDPGMPDADLLTIYQNVCARVRQL